MQKNAAEVSLMALMGGTSEPPREEPQYLKLQLPFLVKLEVPTTSAGNKLLQREQKI